MLGYFGQERLGGGGPYIEDFGFSASTCPSMLSISRNLAPLSAISIGLLPMVAY